MAMSLSSLIGSKTKNSKIILLILLNTTFFLILLLFESEKIQHRTYSLALLQPMVCPSIQLIPVPDPVESSPQPAADQPPYDCWLHKNTPLKLHDYS